MQIASWKFASILTLVLAGLLTMPGFAAANAARSPCQAVDGRRASLGAVECDTLANRPDLDRVVVFHDRTVTVQVLRTDMARRGDIIEASLVFNFSTATKANRDGDGPRSQLRRQMFDCARNTHAIRSTSDYLRPVARGEPSAVSRTPDSPMRATDPGSLDARVGAALCAMVKA